jgi:FtsH-binding integral membrane protein
MIFGGHYCEFGIDDYVIAAMQVYLDIIMLFLHILRLIGDRK